MAISKTIGQWKCVDLAFDLRRRQKSNSKLRDQQVQRQKLERHQVWIYLAAILAGLALGSAAPWLSEPFEAVLWPALGLLLYTTFTQVRLTHLPEAFRDGRFMSAVLVG
ncbi:MAG: hypothetical protein ACK4UZ_11930, partial [Rhizobium rhizophilum]